MFTRPPLGATAAMLGGIVLTYCFILTPIGSHDTDYGIKLWWSRIAPRSYAMHTLARAPFVFVRDGETPATRYLDPWSRAWQGLIASPGAESNFRRLYSNAGPAGRFYALLGLYEGRAISLPTVLARAQADSSIVQVRRRSCQCHVARPLTTLGQIDSLRAYASFLVRPGTWEGW